MKFTSATIHVFNMDKTLKFFNGLLGLPIMQQIAIEDGRVALLGVEGQPSLSFIERASYEGTRHEGFSIAIELVSFDETLSRLNEEGYRVLRGPFIPQPGSRLCFVSGPEGIEVELIEKPQ